MTVLVISLGFREQRIDVNQGIGVALGFLGIVLVTGALGGLSLSSWKGSLELLAATLCYGISFPYSRRYVNVLNYPPRALAATQVTCSALLLAPFTLIGGVTVAPWSTKSIWGILILGALGTGFAYIWNFRNVRLAGSLTASTVTYLTPIVATILGVWLLGEKFALTQVIGGIFVLISGALVQKRLTLIKSS
jgi:drug/metabolite transporter (DMT)-like permease